MFGLSELAIILIVVIAVLAAKKLPDLARSAGKSARILKAEARAMKEEQALAGEPTTPRVIEGETVTPGPTTAPAKVPRPATPPDAGDSRTQD
ncbi:twin-arginine translocase TatA/TatE family subunit [Streptomyces sp. KR55]|uniref:twin-arginine translocase TatA/TatE family subunit n=1 Tax=Streptomyces sp. KR55 TaxID=3457425 RepID=UPI003FD06833